MPVTSFRLRSFSSFLRSTVIVTALAGVAVAAPAVKGQASDAETQAALARVPLRFENTAKPNQWIARSFGFAVAVTDNQAIVALGDRALSLQFTGAQSTSNFTGENKSATPTNYFGRDAHTQNAFLNLRQSNVYPGIDVVYYGVGQSLEYDFDLAPGADPSAIRMRFAGADSTRIEVDGSLVLTVNGREITQRAPVTYQKRGANETVAVSSSYIAEADGSYSIRLGKYDSSRPLVIDPQVLFTAYLAGGGSDGAIGIGKDKNGSIYLAGYTFSVDFPSIGTTFTTFSGFFTQPNEHIFTTKMNPLSTGNDVITYSGIFGGEFGDMLKTFTVDSDGVFYMAGLTDDHFFPVTTNAYSQDNGDVRKMFLAVLDTRIVGQGALTYATFFGSATNTDGSISGTEEPTAIALGGGHVFITGFTNSDLFPVKNEIQTKHTGSNDAFVAEFDITQSGAASLVHSTYFGGFSNDNPKSIVVDADKKVYLVGNTSSSDFPTTTGSYKPFYSGGTDAFVSKLDLDAKSILYSSYIGGYGIDQAQKVLLTANGLVAIAGFTQSPDFPTTANAMQIKAGGDGDTFLMLLNLNAQFTDAVIYSTLYGGSGADFPYDMRIGPSGAFYLVGYTLSRDLPVIDALRSASGGGSVDGYVAIIDPSLPFSNSLIYSSYVTGGGYQIPRGVEVDAVGNVYVTGVALGNIFDPGQDSPPASSNTNAFIFVFHPSPPAVVRQDVFASPIPNIRDRRSR